MATPPGGRIDVATRLEGDKAVVTIADNGAGIAPEHLSSIFRLFSSGGRNRDRADGGLGVGLSLVRRLVDAAWGQCHGLEPRPGTREYVLGAVADAPGPMQDPLHRATAGSVQRLVQRP